MAQLSLIRDNTAAPSVSAEIACPSPLARPGYILVVEDRDDVRLGIAQLLELHGFQVIDAADGEQGLATLRSEGDDVALVLLDLLLPGLSGRDLRARQLTDPELASIPTLIVSSCEPSADRLMELQPAAWLEKPFRFDALLALVRQYVTPTRESIARFI